MQNKEVLEVAIFTVKPGRAAAMPGLRESLRAALRDFPGLIELQCYTPCDGSEYADIARWASQTDAKAAADAFARGDARFLPYMEAIENLRFMGHFAPSA
jgi:antibiotic biosynthesis monooxygenase (ABM) superfamily enzyme